MCGGVRSRKVVGTPPATTGGSREEDTKVITGTQRVQYEFLVPSYYPGTFTTNSCLGTGKFKAKPVKH
jgi:hypothetical protein